MRWGAIATCGLPRPGTGYRNGYRPGRVKNAKGAIEYSFAKRKVRFGQPGLSQIGSEPANASADRDEVREAPGGRCWLLD